MNDNDMTANHAFEKPYVLIRDGELVLDEAFADYESANSAMLERMFGMDLEYRHDHVYRDDGSYRAPLVDGFWDNPRLDVNCVYYTPWNTSSDERTPFIYTDDGATYEIRDRRNYAGYQEVCDKLRRVEAAIKELNNAVLTSPLGEDQLRCTGLSEFRAEYESVIMSGLWASSSWTC